MVVQSSIRRFLTVSFLLAACGGGGSSPGDDDTPPTDSPTGDGPTGACTAESSYDAGAATSTGAAFGCETAGCAIADAEVVFVDGNLDADASPDLFAIELYKGLGVFAGGITTGSFPITGAEANYGTCGACVLIYTDFDGTNIVDTYMATGGTLTITSLTPTVTGTVSNATFTHVTVDDKTFESTPVGDCDSAATGDYAFSQTATELAQ